MVFRTLLRLTGSAEHVDDLAQEVFSALYKALPGFRGEALVSTYLYRIAVNVAQDEWKRRRREDKPLVSISDDASEWPWEDRLAHPDRNAEEVDGGARICAAGGGADATVERSGAGGAGSLSSGGAVV